MICVGRRKAKEKKEKGSSSEVKEKNLKDP